MSKILLIGAAKYELKSNSGLLLRLYTQLKTKMSKQTSSLIPRQGDKVNERKISTKIVYKQHKVNRNNPYSPSRGN